MKSSSGIHSNRRGFLGALVAMMAGSRLARAGEISPSLQRRIDSHLEAASIACQQSADRAIAAVDTYFGECNDAVMKFGGSISAEHGVGSLKADTLHLYKDPVALQLMRSIKQAIDPQNVMNPGRVLVNSSLND